MPHSTRELAGTLVDQATFTLPEFPTGENDRPDIDTAGQVVAVGVGVSVGVEVAVTVAVGVPVGVGVPVPVGVGVRVAVGVGTGVLLGGGVGTAEGGTNLMTFGPYASPPPVSILPPGTTYETNWPLAELDPTLPM